MNKNVRIPVCISRPSPQTTESCREEGEGWRHFRHSDGTQLQFKSERSGFSPIFYLYSHNWYKFIKCCAHISGCVALNVKKCEVFRDTSVNKYIWIIFSLIQSDFWFPRLYYYSRSESVLFLSVQENISTSCCWFYKTLYYLLLHSEPSRTSELVRFRSNFSPKSQN